VAGKGILVTGATGKVGDSVLSQLRDQGLAVRALVRDPRRAALRDGVEVAHGDLADPASLGSALDGVDSVYLVWPTLAADHAAAATVAEIAQRARRIVYLSAMASPRRRPEESSRPMPGWNG
jgi:uncharacterized protein YbjT (DUF2867 family)